MTRYRRLYLGPLWEDELPALDFERIESAAQLTFNDEARQGLRWIVARYLRDDKAAQNIPAREVKSQLRKIANACRMLEAVLEIGNGGLVDEINAKPVLQAAWWHSHVPGVEIGTSHVGGRHPVLADEGDILNYLREWREQAERAAAFQVACGPATDEPSRKFLSDAHAIYSQAGGPGRGCYPNVPDGYAGRFLEFVLAALAGAEQDPARSTWAERILEAIPAG